MSLTVCLGANCLRFTDCGGHLWVFLNWALGLRSLGCNVIWLEWVPPGESADGLAERVQLLKSRLAEFGLDSAVALYSWDTDLSGSAARACLDIDAAAHADLFINIAYDGFPPDVIARFRRSILVDIDPGLTQLWVAGGGMQLHAHHCYFSIGETAGRPDARFPSCGVRWLYTPPPIALDHWPVASADGAAPYTTVTNWGGAPIKFEGRICENAKKTGFSPFLGLPKMTTVPLKLAIPFGETDDTDLPRLQAEGWDICDCAAATVTPERYRTFIQQSRGEFSCAKPLYVRLETAWISDRTICYLASGKPAVVQHTGPSGFLPDAEGVFRFRTVEEAAHALDTLETDYERQCHLARALAEEYFDARKVVRSVLERAMDGRVVR